MTNRERFKVIMNFQKPDCIPAIEYAPYWHETLKVWYTQGLDKNIPAEQLRTYLGADDMFEYVVLFPRRDDRLDPLDKITDSISYDMLMPILYPDDVIQSGKEAQMRLAQEQKQGDKAAGIVLFGFFWWPRELFGMEEFLYKLYEDPGLILRINSDLLKHNLRAVHIQAEIYQPDFYIVSEDMCYKHGTLISRDMFNQFMLPFYKELIPELKQNGATVLMDTDGFFEPMLDWIVEAGFDGVSPVERNAGNDLYRIREAYPDIKMIGGVNKMELCKGETAIKRELDSLIPVIRSGGYLPSCDHQTPPGVCLEDYKLYMKMLRRICQG